MVSLFNFICQGVSLFCEKGAGVESINRDRTNADPLPVKLLGKFRIFDKVI